MAVLASLLAIAGFALQSSSAEYTRDLQVFPPVLALSSSGQVELTDSFVDASVKQTGHPTCQETLVTHTFGESYYVPYVGPYQTPSCEFNRVTWNMTVSVAGVQFDRLGTIYLGDIEVWRPTTAEPTEQGIYYTYLKVRMFVGQTWLFVVDHIILPGHDSFPLTVKVRSDFDIQTRQYRRQHLHRSFQRYPDVSILHH